MKLVLECDGTEIDEEYIPFLEKNTTLILLKSNEKWEFIKGMQLHCFFIVLEIPRLSISLIYLLF